MKNPPLNPQWPESCREAWFYDQEEVFGKYTHYGHAYAYENRMATMMGLIREVLNPGASILDLAAAQGNYTLRLAEAGYRMTWNDLRPELADYVRSKWDHGEVHYRSGDAFALDFPEPFDGVVVTEIIEHVAHPDQFLSKAASLVRPGGYVFLSTPNGSYFQNQLPRFSECADPSVYEKGQFKPNSDGHIFLLHSDEWENLALRADLKIDHIGFFNNVITSGYLKTEGLLRCLPRRWIMAQERLSQRMPDHLRHRFLVHTGVRFQRPDPAAARRTTTKAF